jgi:hypothetical protein
MEPPAENGLLWSAGKMRCTVGASADGRLVVNLTEGEKALVTAWSHSWNDALERAAELRAIFGDSVAAEER